MSNRVETLLFDLSRQEPEEMSLGVMENRDTPDLSKRIAPFKLGFDFEGRPKLAYGRETELKEAEYQGMMAMLELAREGYEQVFWLSPTGGRSEGEYTEGRLVVARLIKNNETGVVFEGRGVVILAGPEEMLWKARMLEVWGEAARRIEVAEDLRENPIGVDVGKMDLWDFCESIFEGMPEVWQTIREGKDLEMKEEVVEVAMRAKEEVRITLGRIGVDNSLVATAMWEGIMAREGYRVMGGNHGVMSSSMLGRRGVFDSIFNEGKRPKVDSEGRTYCEFCHRYYTGEKCPYCN